MASYSAANPWTSRTHIRMVCKVDRTIVDYVHKATRVGVFVMLSLLDDIHRGRYTRIY